MAVYQFRCLTEDCVADCFELEIPMSDYNEDKGICPVCGKKGRRRLSEMPGVTLKGLGFYQTDKEYQEQLKTAEAIADGVYDARAKQDPKLSQNDDFWQELASKEFHKEVQRNRLYMDVPPTTVLPKYEDKATTTVAKDGVPAKVGKGKGKGNRTKAKKQPG